MRMLRIVIIGEAESVVGIEPAVFGMAPFVGFSELIHKVSFVAQLNSIPADSRKTMFLG
jgi:hypothetical protein